MSNDAFKLCWNQPIQTNAIIRHNKPDIVLYDLKLKHAPVVEVAVSWHTRLEQQRQLKLHRYTVDGNIDEVTTPFTSGENIERDLISQKWKVTFVRIVIGACGEVCKEVLGGLGRLGLTGKDAGDCIKHMSRSAVLGSNRLIKNHLA